MTSVDDEGGWVMSRATPIGGATPPEMSTGNEADDELLKQIAARSSLDKPRDWQHFLHVPTEGMAYGVAGPLEAIGWHVYVVPPDPDDDEPAWCVIAEMTNIILTAKLVGSTRSLFESVAGNVPGANYDGWQASIDWDDSLAEDRQDWPDSLK
jgi:hypothetical protein